MSPKPNEKRDFVADAAKVLKRVLDSERRKLPSIDEAAKKLRWDPKTKSKQHRLFEENRQALLERLKRSSGRSLRR